MPGWPTVDRSDDHALVDALRRLTADAPARLYDTYGERLHDYACALIGPGDRGADSVHDALVTAQSCVERLREGTRLRPWLYALTRFQAMARLAHGEDAPTEAMPAQPIGESDDPELSDLVHDVLGELSGNEREALELSLRHGLTPAETGAVLGLTSRQAAARLARGRERLENAAAAVVLARTGRAHCPDLSAMLDSWKGPLTPILRRRLSGHIGGCEVCAEGRDRQVSAARLLDMVPVAFPPLSLRRRVVETCLDPGCDQTRTLITERSDSFDRTGFPVTVEHRVRHHKPHRLAPVVLAAMALLGGTGAVIVLTGGSPTTTLRAVPAPSATAPESPQSLSDAPSDIGEQPTEEDDATPAAGPTRTLPAAEPSAAPPSARPTPRAARTRAAAPTRRAALPRARLAADCPSGSGTDSGTDQAAQVELTARNATIVWSAAATSGLGVSPAKGSIKAGASAVIWITVDDPGTEGSGTVSFSSNGGGARCSLSWPGQQPATPAPDGSIRPPASADPTESAEDQPVEESVASSEPEMATQP